MSRRANPFRPAVVLGLLLVGALSFLLLLYALGAGWTGQSDRDGGAHAASNSLTGYAGLVDLLERQGFTVSLSRSPAALNDEALVVLTPGQFFDPEELDRIIEERRYAGPTMLVLPKWAAMGVPDDPRIEAKDGWVVLSDVWSPEWFGEVEAFSDTRLGSGRTGGWSGFGLSGELADAERVQGIEGEDNETILPIVTDSEGDILAGYLDRKGFHPGLADAAGITFSAEEEKMQDDNIWPLIVVAEPDLLNNYGMADEERAYLAVTLVGNAMDGYDLPIVFDMTLPGLGSSENLLTLAFRPPFLAATLCLLLAALVIAWRGFRRFGPPVAEVPAMAQGKKQLARNGAALIERAKRWHLLGAPYATLVASRIAGALHIREGDHLSREAAIDEAMIHHGLEGPRFSEKADALRRAQRPADMVRAAAALRSIERMLTR